MIIPKTASGTLRMVAMSDALLRPVSEGSCAVADGLGEDADASRVVFTLIWCGFAAEASVLVNVLPLVSKVDGVLKAVKEVVGPANSVRVEPAAMLRRELRAGLVLKEGCLLMLCALELWQNRVSIRIDERK